MASRSGPPGTRRDCCGIAGLVITLRSKGTYIVKDARQKAERRLAPHDGRSADSD
jgi:hypothetical protein